MSSNHVEVTSPEHFKELLSADLKRVSCLNFWAPWAEPCAAFNKDIEAAAAKYPSVLFLKVSRAVREDHMASLHSKREMQGYRAANCNGFER